MKKKLYKTCVYDIFENRGLVSEKGGCLHPIFLQYPKAISLSTDISTYLSALFSIYIANISFFVAGKEILRSIVANAWMLFSFWGEEKSIQALAFLSIRLFGIL